MQQQKKESSEASLTESLWVLWVGGQGKHAGLHAARAGVGGGAAQQAHVTGCVPEAGWQEISLLASSVHVRVCTVASKQHRDLLCPLNSGLVVHSICEPQWAYWSPPRNVRTATLSILIHFILCD